jgi:serine phosphatase RsbU (regulator of sigma subunit)
VERLSVDALEWAVAARAHEAVSGDGCVVQPVSQGVLVATVDGIGHGEAAQEAAHVAMRLLREFAQEPPVALVARCHAALRSTRGVALSLASIDSRRSTLTWLGIGNVAGILLRMLEGVPTIRDSLIPGAGIVGRRVPPLTTVSLELRSGDMLVFATDGVRGNFACGIRALDSPRQAADRILAEHATAPDDALVVVARYRGGAA